MERPPSPRTTHVADGAQAPAGRAETRPLPKDKAETRPLPKDKAEARPLPTGKAEARPLRCMGRSASLSSLESEATTYAASSPVLVERLGPEGGTNANPNPHP